MGQGKLANNVFYKAYTDSSNLAVGTFMGGTGSGWPTTYFWGSKFVLLFSSNKSDLPHTTGWWWEGWSAGQNMEPKPVKN
jgi:hypothetical protein